MIFVHGKEEKNIPNWKKINISRVGLNVGNESVVHLSRCLKFQLSYGQIGKLGLRE